MSVTTPVHALHFPGGSEIRLDCSTRVLSLTVSANTSVEHTALQLDVSAPFPSQPS